MTLQKDLQLLRDRVIFLEEEQKGIVVMRNVSALPVLIGVTRKSKNGTTKVVTPGDRTQTSRVTRGTAGPPPRLSIRLESLWLEDLVTLVYMYSRWPGSS